MAEFVKKFGEVRGLWPLTRAETGRQKTKNAWDKRASFKKAPNGYSLVEISRSACLRSSIRMAGLFTSYCCSSGLSDVVKKESVSQLSPELLFLALDFCCAQKKGPEKPVEREPSKLPAPTKALVDMIFDAKCVHLAPACFLTLRSFGQKHDGGHEVVQCGHQQDAAGPDRTQVHPGGTSSISDAPNESLRRATPS